MEQQLIALAIQELPSIVAGVKSLFAQQNPDLPALTDAQVFEALNSAYQTSLAKDDAILNQG